MPSASVKTDSEGSGAWEKNGCFSASAAEIRASGWYCKRRDKRAKAGAAGDRLHRAAKFGTGNEPLQQKNMGGKNPNHQNGRLRQSSDPRMLTKIRENVFGQNKEMNE